MGITVLIRKEHVSSSCIIKHHHTTPFPQTPPPHLEDYPLVKHCLDFLAVVGGYCPFNNSSSPEHPLAAASKLALTVLQLADKGQVRILVRYIIN